MATVERTCDKRFEGAHEAFAGTADVGLDVGAFLTRRGEVVTDLRHGQVGQSAALTHLVNDAPNVVRHGHRLLARRHRRSNPCLRAGLGFTTPPLKASASR
jgi:ribose 5-phosphate isomerase